MLPTSHPAHVDFPAPHKSSTKEAAAQDHFATGNVFSQIQPLSRYLCLQDFSTVKYLTCSQFSNASVLPYCAEPHFSVALILKTCQNCVIFISFDIYLINIWKHNKSHQLFLGGLTSELVMYQWIFSLFDGLFMSMVCVLAQLWVFQILSAGMPRLQNKRLAPRKKWQIVDLWVR